MACAIFCLLRAIWKGIFGNSSTVVTLLAWFASQFATQLFGVLQNEFQVALLTKQSEIQSTWQVLKFKVRSGFPGSEVNQVVRHWYKFPLSRHWAKTLTTTKSDWKIGHKTDWQSFQAVPCLSPYGTLNRLQSPHDTDEDNRQRLDGRMEFTNTVSK